jgi:hypothetical protein
MEYVQNREGLIRMSYLYGSDDSDNEPNDGIWNIPASEEVVPDESSDFKEFKTALINAKRKLYEANVSSDKIPSDMKQSPELLKNYRRDLEKLYIYSVNLQNKSAVSVNIDEFPEETRDSIQLALNIVKDFFNKNSIPETIPYSSFIRSILKEYPYVQRDLSLDDGEEDNGYFSG